MIKAILGKKIGMTQIFDKNSKAIPVTVVEAGPCDITEIKNQDKDGYEALQVVYDQKKKISRALKGHLIKSKTKQNKYLVEFRTKKNNKDKIEAQNLKVGNKISVDLFKVGDKIQVTGNNKGKGFAGVMKRHDFKGSPASHGHERPRSPGSIGCRFPQRTIIGKRMAGQMGTRRITVKGLRIVDIDLENNLLAISGSIPGPNKGLIKIIGEE